MTALPGALLIPEVRWDRDRGFEHLRDAVHDALALGVGGFVLRGAPPRDAAAAFLAQLLRDAGRPLLIAADAERGAGQCLMGATGLPPFGAFGALRDEDAVRRAARLTARELRAVGVNWALAPCADLAVEPRNPVIGSRALGGDSRRVAEWVVAWIDACQAEGVLACAKHLPGIGRVLADPALDAVRVESSGATLWSEDLVPFRGAVDTGVASVLVSQVSYQGLDASGVGAARSKVILEELMRRELRYDGLLVSDSPSRHAALEAGGEGHAAVAALAAGCDLLLAPHDLQGVLEAIEAARDAGTLARDAFEASLARRDFWTAWGSAAAGREATLDDVLWARQVADTVVYAVRGVFTHIGPVVDVVCVDDESEGTRGGDEAMLAPFLATLRAMGHAPRLEEGPTGDGRGAVVVAVRGEPAHGRGRAGYTAATRARIAGLMSDARAARRSVVAVLFGPPVLADELPQVPNVICAWGGDRAMQEAVARRLG